MLKPNICQDRLGTSIVKVEGEGRFLQQDAAALVTTARLYDWRRDCLLPADVHGAARCDLSASRELVLLHGVHLPAVVAARLAAIW
jgi:hypothetical protein